MPQTLLGLLGLVLASLLSLQQLRAGIDTDEKLRNAEVQALASGVATSQLNALEALPYDEAVKNAYITSAAQLTPVVGAGFYRPSGDTANDDLDDAHGASETSSHVLRDGQTGLRLQSDVVVGYMSESDGVTPSAVPTRLKRATVTVTSADTQTDPVILSQLYSCGSYCNW